MKRGKRQAYVSKLIAMTLAIMLICGNIFVPLQAEELVTPKTSTVPEEVVTQNAETTPTEDVVTEQTEATSKEEASQNDVVPAAGAPGTEQPVTPDTSTWDKIKVFETTDIHGHITDVSTYQEDTFQYRMAYISKIVNEARENKEYDGVLLLDGGDIYQGTPHSNLTFGAAVRAAFDQMQYDAVGLGNHEFDWDVKKYAADNKGTMAPYSIGSYTGDSDIPVLMNNLYDKESGKRVDFTQDYTIVNKGGYTVGILGWSDDYSADIKASQIAPYTIDSDVQKLKDAAKEVDAKADVVVILTHSDPAALAEQMDPEVVDLVAGGHTHKATNGTASNGVDYMQGKSKAEGYATTEIRINPENKEQVEVVTPTFEKIYEKKGDNSKLYYQNGNNAALDPAVSKISQAAWDAVKGDMYEVLGTVDQSITRDFIDETNSLSSIAGNWLTGLMLDATKEHKTVAAFANRGGIRTDLNMEAGKNTRDITVADIYTISPFGNRILTFAITGKEMAQQLESALIGLNPAIGNGRAGEGYQASNLGDQFSGIKAVYKVVDGGIKVLSIKTDDGKEIDINDTKTTYNVCVNEYCATLAGSVFKGKTPIVPMDDAPVDNLSTIEALRNHRDTNGEKITLDTTPHTVSLSTRLTQIKEEVAKFENKELTKEEVKALKELGKEINGFVASNDLDATEKAEFTALKEKVEAILAKYDTAEPVLPLKEIKDGATVAVYHPVSKQMMTSEVINGKYFGSVAVEEAADGLVVPAEAEVFKVVKNGQFYQFVKDNQYLTYNGGGFKYEAAPDATGLSDWELLKADENGGFFIKNSVAEYKGNKEQCFQYNNKFKNFAVRGKNEKYVTDYVMKLYPATVKAPVDPQPAPQPDVNTQVTELADGYTVAVYHPASKQMMSSEVINNKFFGGVAVDTAAEGFVVPTEAAVFKIVKNDKFYQFVKDGKYLTYNGGGFKYEAAPDATGLSDWELIKADDKGGFFIKNKVAEYNGNKEQCFQYNKKYKNFAVRGKNDKYASDYVMQFYYAKREGYTVEADKTFGIAQWAGTGNYEAVKETVAGDLYLGNDMKDTAATYSAVVNGKKVVPYTVVTNKDTGVNSYYLGGAGLGSGTNDYAEFALSSQGYANMNLALRLRASNTAPGAFTVQYSTDGTAFKNFTNGTYKYVKYGQGEKKGTITDGIAKTSMNAGKYIDFTFEVPKEAEHAEKLFIRFVPNDKKANGKPGAISDKGTVRFESVVITGSPVIADDLCGYVVANPASGQAAAGTKITLSSATADAEIYYAVNGGEFVRYKAPFELTEMPATIRTYAKKAGMKDSIAINYTYTLGKVKNVTATPNGGAVLEGTEVTLACATEGATIQYSEDDGKTWVDYTAPIKLTNLSDKAKTYLVKAVKAGFEDSNVITLSYTKRKNAKYGIYFGQLHSHTNYSDGAGTADEAFKHASGVENLDFLAVTDHSNSFDNDKAADINNGSVSAEWKEGRALADKYTKDGEFVGLFGFEMTWSNGLGHLNTFNSPGFQSRNQDQFKTYGTALQTYYSALKSSPNSISQFNHPGTTFGDFSDFAHYDTEIDKLITTIEVGNGEGKIGSSGYFPSYEYYQRALDKGWHVAPTNNQDNHKGLWGDANTARSVVLADTLSQTDVYDAMRNYRVYATEDNDLNIYYTLDGREMGSILSQGQTGETVNIKAELSDVTDKEIGKVQVITNGGIVLAEKNVTSNNEVVEFAVNNNYSYYYLKVVQKDGDIAVTAPVWVSAVEAAGISKLSTDEVLPVKGETLKVDLGLYNNEAKDLQLNSIEFKVGEEVVHTADLTKANLTKVPSLGTADYSFDFTYDKVGKMELAVEVKGTLNGAERVYKSVLKLTYVTPEMVTRVVIDGTHFNDYVTGYYGGNMGNFTKIAGDKNIKVQIVKDKKDFTPELLKDCALLIISAPAKRSGTANAGDYKPDHFEDEFIQTVKGYTDNGGTLIACGIADYQDRPEGQTTTEMNKLLEVIGATTRLNSDEAYDTENNGGQPYRLYFANTYDKVSKYLFGATEDQKYSAYSGCTVNMNADAVAAGKATALVKGYKTTYSVDTKDEAGNKLPDQPVVVEKGNVVILGHEVLNSGANVFVSSTVFMSDFEVKAELDNIWDKPYLNKTIIDNILDDVAVELPVTPIKEVRKANEDEVFTVEGYVTAGRDNEHNRFFDAFYIQDATGGLTIFPYGENDLALGDKVRVTGYVDYYQGDKEIQIMRIKKLPDDKKIIDPTLLSTKDAMDYDKNGGMLVKVQGTVTRIGDAKNGAVNQFWVKDKSGVEANVFIDGYINSGTTGKNTLGSIVKVGAMVEAVGLVYAHPEGESDVPVTCLRVRNCDEIKAVSEGTNPDEYPGGGQGGNPDGNPNGQGGQTGNGQGGQSGNGNQNGQGGHSGNGNQNGQGGQSGNGQNGKPNKPSAGQQNSNAVQTGDNAPIVGYVVLLILAGAAVVTVLVMRRRQANR